MEFQYDYNSSLGNFSKSTSTHQGLVAKLWKVVKVDGEVQSREEFNNSSYNSSPTIITVGVAGASSSQLSSIKSAAASGDESRVRAAVSAAKAANEQKVKEAQEKAKEEAKKEEEAKKKEEAKEEKKDNKKKEKTDKTQLTPPGINQNASSILELHIHNLIICFNYCITDCHSIL